MSQTPSISQPPEPLTSTPSRIPPPPQPEALEALEGTVRRLRAELAATTERSRQARLLAEIADLEERSGDEPAAARDYLAAYNADSGFREPLEGLVRLLEKRRSLKNLGRLIEALVRAASSPDEKARALLMRAAYQADVSGEVADAKATAREATEVDGAPTAEQASSWLTLEVLAGRTGDTPTREQALSHRTAFAAQPQWRALLLVDRARIASAAGEVTAAIELLREARSLGSEATWTATAVLEQLVREHAGSPGTDEARARAEVHIEALEATAALLDEAAVDEARGDALGVPHWVREPSRRVDAWLRAADAHRLLGDLPGAAATMDRALDLVGTMTGDDATLAEGAVSNARIRIAEQRGNTALAAQLAERRLTTEKNGALAAALALRVAEHAASEGDGPRALEALSRAIANDPGCLPARALQLDALADGGDGAAFAAQLESFADHLATDEARGRAFLLAAYVWAVRANDVAGAKAALSQAAMYGVAPSTTGRVARALASIAGDAAWYEEATKRLLAAGGSEAEALSLYVELVRSRQARNDTEGAARALRDMAGAPRGAWLSRVLEAFLPSPEAAPESDPERTVAKAGGRARAAVEELAALESDPELARGLWLVAAMRAVVESDAAAARKLLRDLADKQAGDPIVAAFLGDLERAGGDFAAAARTASEAAAATSDVELAGALHLEAGLERWRSGDRKAAIEELEAALAKGAPEAARMVLAWAARGVDADSIEGRRRAIERGSAAAAADARVLSLERFATEVGGGDPDEAAAALAAIDRAPDGDLGLAGALARFVWSGATGNADAMRDAVVRVAARGPRALLLATAEQVRLAREAGDRVHLAHTAGRWFDAGGGLPAALEWLAAALVLGEPLEEKRARLAVASSLQGDARETLLASAALLEPRIHPSAAAPLAVGATPAVRLANLELAPPGCDPRRRAATLTHLDALGDEAGVDAAALAGWAALAASDLASARAAFEEATAARPGDLAAGEGLRSCGEQSGDRALRARAAAELGARCSDAARGAAFWEEAGLAWIELGDDANADRALEASFARDAGRAVGFDKLFRRVRERKDNDKFLGIVARRLEVTDEPHEIQKLYWEQARVLREKGDQDGALRALEHVTMLEPDHVGALALIGEVNIRRGNFEAAADSLGRLATLEAAPAKNRVTAGVAAVDLYENKLNRFDKALEVLLVLHRAKLSTLPVRERLARAAARTGSWGEATKILEELMHERPEADGRIEAARLAMAIHRDRLGRPEEARAAIVQLLEEAPTDGEAIDMLLQIDAPRDVRDRLLGRAQRALVDSLQKRPADVTGVRRLVKVSRALGDDALHQAALGALISLGAGDAQSDQAFVLLAAKKARVPQVAISELVLRSIMAPGDEGPLADLFMMLGPTLAEALGPSLQACGVGRRDKVDPRSGLALRNEVASWAGAFGVREFDLYVGGKDPLGVQGVPGELPALVVGAGVNAPLAPSTRARVARELLAMLRGTTVVRSRDDITIAAVVVAACRLAEVPIQHPPYAMLAEVERLIGKAIARKTRRLITDACRAIVGTGADARAWSRRALASHDRVATVASGDVSVVLGDVLGVTTEKLGPAVKGNPRAEELLRFVLSPQYLDIRRSLGLEGGA
jgi:lipopolysaccharide biosynthesis regulator YciM